MTAQEPPTRQAAEVQTELLRIVTAPNRSARGVGARYEINYCIYQGGAGHLRLVHLAAAQADEALEAGHSSCI